MIFSYNSLYAEANPYTTYFVLGKPVVATNACSSVTLSGRILLYRLKSVEKYSEGKIHKVEPEPRNDKLCKYCLLLHSSGIILESVERGLFTLTINEHTIANVCLYLCFQPRIMYVKYTLTN